jgi:hypothetical protein
MTPDHIQIRFARVTAIVCLFILSGASQLAGASIDFSYESYPESRDISEMITFSAACIPLEQSEYSFIGAGYLIQDTTIDAPGWNGRRIILTCGELTAAGTASHIRLLVVDDGDGGRSRIARRVGLGNGEAPHLTQPSPAARDILFRVIRTGNNSEASIYSIDGDTGRLTESIRIDRSFQKRIGLDVRGTLLPRGFIEISSKNPPTSERLDLSGALAALVEDEIYQPNGRPIPSLANLTLARGGWEDERIYEIEGSVHADVGMSLVTLSKKQVIDVTVVLSKDGGGRWSVSDIKFEPFMAYRQ